MTELKAKANEALAARQAGDLWDSLRDNLVNAEATLTKIIETRAWEPLGYSNFLEAWNDRLKGVRLATDAMRAAVVYAMLDSGASDREVVEAAGVGDARVARLRGLRALGVSSTSAAASPRAKRGRGGARYSSTISFGLEPAEFARIEELCAERGVAVAELARRGLRLQVYAMEAER